jgi:NitT/TauT family transport system permease protein
MKANASRLQTIAPLLASPVVALLLWQGAVRVFNLPKYVLPAPLAVWNALAVGLGITHSTATFWPQLGYTVEATIGGFVVGSILGLGLAVIMAESTFVERMVMPYVVGFQSMPKVAIAPLFVIWFGYQLTSQIAMSATLAFFPVLLSALQGLTTTQPERLELLTSLGASRWQRFLHVRFPSALPLIFTGLNLAIVYALLGVIVAEFLGAQHGMGVVITQLQSVSDTAGVFAGLVVLAVTGYALLAVLRIIQKRSVFWERDTRSDLIG